jgi:hypothetical protein
VINLESLPIRARALEKRMSGRINLRFKQSS